MVANVADRWIGMCVYRLSLSVLFFFFGPFFLCLPSHVTHSCLKLKLNSMLTNLSFHFAAKSNFQISRRPCFATGEREGGGG